MTDEQVFEWFRQAREFNYRDPETFNPVLAFTLDVVQDAGIDAMRKFIGGGKRNHD